MEKQPSSQHPHVPNKHAEHHHQSNQNQTPTRVEHQFFTKMQMPGINSIENDLMKLLNDFSQTRLKKYGMQSDNAERERGSAIS